MACSPYNSRYADEETVKELYLLILKKQYGLASKEDIERLKELAYDYLCYAYRTLHDWLACHGYFTFDDFYECWFINEETCQLPGLNFLERLRDALNRAERYFCMGEDYLYEEVLNIPILGIRYDLDDVLRNGVRKLYELYKENIVYLPQYENIVKTYKELEKWAKHPWDYPLKELILLVDRVTDTEHSAGNLLWDWGGIDVESAKEEAEEEFEKILGGGE